MPSIVNFSNINNVEIYVADNASTDDSIAFVKKTFPTVKIVQNKKSFRLENLLINWLTNQINALISIKQNKKQTKLWPVPVIHSKEEPRFLRV